MKKKKWVLGVILLMLVLQGCSLKVTKMEPQPNVNVNPSSKSLALQYGNKVEDQFEFKSSNGFKNTQVTDWHGSLKDGFNNAFSEFYQLEDSVENAELVLKIDKTNIEFVTNSIVYSAGSFGGVSAGSGKANVTFSATLKEKNGKVIGRVADTAIAKKTLIYAKEVTDNVKSAVESMYEIIADRLFK